VACEALALVRGSGGWKSDWRMFLSLLMWDGGDDEMEPSWTWGATGVKFGFLLYHQRYTTPRQR